VCFVLLLLALWLFDKIMCIGKKYKFLHCITVIIIWHYIILLHSIKNCFIIEILLIWFFEQNARNDCKNILLIVMEFFSFDV